MYEELIQKMNPKPELNLKWYKNADLYSEGDVEDLIIKLISENEPEDYVETIYDNYNWSTFYHLSHIRQNILNWYSFDDDAELLEIGCGMGAITGMLCDKVKSVTAVELSKRRATAALLRCRKKENLEIIVGNLNDIEFNKKFDYITLIGVLEYQGSYTDTDNPYMDFLKKIKSLLKPNGKLLVAIENQYGLKYWCGAREDHTGFVFDGINGYSLSNKRVRTFSRNALRQLIEESGFKNTFFYYPMPDYKLPTVVYSEKMIPTDSNMQNMRPYYIPNDSTLIAEEAVIYQDLIDNGVFEFFANSFLVECTNDESVNHVTFVSLNSIRCPEYRVGTRFIENEKVERFIMSGAIGDDHLNVIHQNEVALSRRGVNILVGRCEHKRLVYDYIDKETLESRFLKEIIKDKDSALSLLDKVYEDILNSSEYVDGSENLIFSFGLNAPMEKSIYGPILKTGYIDMILRNAFWDNGRIIWFDQEWTLENIPAGFVMYRLLKEFYCSNPVIESYISLSEMADRYGIMQTWKVYDQVESLFLSAVIDKKIMAESSVYCPRNKDSVVKNTNFLSSAGVK